MQITTESTTVHPDSPNQSQRSRRRGQSPPRRVRSEIWNLMNKDSGAVLAKMGILIVPDSKTDLRSFLSGDRYFNEIPRSRLAGMVRKWRASGSPGRVRGPWIAAVFTAFVCEAIKRGMADTHAKGGGA